VPDAWIGLPSPWAEVRFIYLPASAFFDPVYGKSYSCIVCSKARQRCVLAREPVEGPKPLNNVENGYDTAKTGQTGEIAEMTLTVRNDRGKYQSRRWRLDWEPTSPETSPLSPCSAL